MTKEELKQIRQSLGLSQKAMGEKLGYTREHYNYFERGRVPITRRTEMLVKSLTLQDG